MDRSDVLAMRPYLRTYPEYKRMTPYFASACAEGFCEGENATVREVLCAWQYLVDTGLAWSLQGWYGRQASAMIEAGILSRK